LAVIDWTPFDLILQLKVTVTLTLNLKNNNGILLVLTNHYTKFEDSRLYRSPVINRKPLTYRPTDHVQSNISPLLSKEGYDME